MADAPQFFLLLGPSGAGKSSLLVPVDGVATFDRDRELQAISPSNDLRNAGKGLIDRIAALEKAYAQEHLDARTSFSYQGTFSQVFDKEPLRIADAAREQGFGVEARFIVAGDVATHIDRAKARARQGSHYVAPSEVKTIYNDSLRNFPVLLEAAVQGRIDRLDLYDNSRSMQNPTLQLSIQRGKAAFVHPDPEPWLDHALEGSAFTVPTLHRAFDRATPLAELDTLGPARRKGLDLALTPDAVLEQEPARQLVNDYGPQEAAAIVREDMQQVRDDLLTDLPERDVMRVLMEQASPVFGRDAGEYADAILAAVKEQTGWGRSPAELPARIDNDPTRIPHSELRQILAASEPSHLSNPGKTSIPALAPIRRNNYPEPDRLAVQERVASAVEQNPQPFFDAYDADPRSLGGRYICSDLFKETFEEFSSSSEGRARYNNPVHNTAAVLSAAQLTRAVEAEGDPQRNTVIFLTGIPGAGKTTAVLSAGELEPTVRAVYEGQLSKPGPAIEKIQQVLDAGLQPAIIVVHTPPETALQNTLSRFEREGRGASLHAMASIQAELPEGLRAIHDQFGDRVAFTVIDRSGGLTRTEDRNGWEHLPAVEKEGNYDRIHGRLSYALDQHREAGTISDDGYRQARGIATRTLPERADSPDGGRPQQLSAGVIEASPVERRGALRFWQETTADHTIKYAAGRLNLPGIEPFPRNLSAQRAVSQGTGYDAGHLIAHQFGGPEIPGNLSLQNHQTNQGGGNYYKLESEWANSLAAGNQLSVNVREMTRPGDDTFYHRHVEWVTTTPAGEMRRDAIDFLNPESERVRHARGIVLTPQPDTGVVLDAKPAIAARLAQELKTIESKAEAALEQRPGFRDEVPVESRKVEPFGRAQGELIAQDDHQIAIATGPNSYALIDRENIKQPMQLGDRLKIELGADRAYVTRMERALER